MDCLSQIMDIGIRLWDCSSKHMAYIQNLKENLDNLRTEKVTLISRRIDVQGRVEVAEQQPQMRRTKEVEVWLDIANTMENEINVIIQEGDQEHQNKCVGGYCPKNLKSTYKIGERISKMRDSLTDLLRKGESFNSDSAVVLRQPRLRLLTVEWRLRNIVGVDSAVERVWSCIVDEKIRIIRLCGLGGVGKTTLLKKVSNEFHRQIHDFDAVLWAEVPRQKDYIEKVQEVLRRKLNIPDDVWNQCSGEGEKGAQIISVLNGKKFVLLLDNVWKQFDLLSLGIDLLNDQNMSKVIFTARSLGLYFDMEAQVTIEVERLPPEQALSLFRMTVGESILSSDPDLSKLANTLARRCAGLPLSLLTVAGAMACRRNLREWRHTIDLLHTDPSEIAGMGGYVFPLLKISYDSLNDARTQNCFLYCSLFPENYNIRIDELIDLWIGEGLLDGPTNPCDQGEFIVGNLKLAYLLESDESKQCVQMHDIFRHMALWLARDQGKNKNKVLVAKSGRITDQELTKWEEATWISLFGSSSRVNIDYSPSCHYLSTLIFRDAQLKSFPNGFFDSMPALKVLDLSGNQGLVELPLDFGNVKNLQYLNLSSTSIAKLPTGLINFRKLRCLLLDHTMNLKWIPKEVISNLLLLQVYSKINGVTEYYSGYMEDMPYDEADFLEVLECLNHINKIGITIFAAPSLEKILKSDMFRSCIRRLTFMECTGLVSLYFREDLSNLESLGLFNCSSIKEFKVSERCKLGNLSKVYIGFCPLLLNLNFLSYARNLEILIIFCCESLKEVTSEQRPFPRLKTISLTHLQNLKSICPSPRCFPSLLEIEVSKCPRLRQLPFDLESANFLLKIIGETEWWDGLIWDDEDEDVKDACDVKFISTPFKGLVKKDHALHIQTECGAFNLSDLPTVAAEALDSPWSLCLHPALRLTAPPPPRPETPKKPSPPRPKESEKKPEKPKEPPRPRPAAPPFPPPPPRPKELEKKSEKPKEPEKKSEKPKEPSRPKESEKKPEKPKEPPRPAALPFLPPPPPPPQNKSKKTKEPRPPRPAAPPFLPPPPPPKEPEKKSEKPKEPQPPLPAAPLSLRPAPTPCPDVPLRPHPALHPAARTRPCPAEPPLVMTSESHNDNQLNLEDIDAIKVIGKGNGGVVQLVQHKWTGQFFALKIIQMNIEESARKQIVNILKINKSFQCPYVVVCYQSFCTNGAISIILEYMDGGSLADFLKKVKSISEPYLAAICKQVLKGLMYLHHGRNIIHRDLKPSNLLINHRGEVKINDFGVSAMLTSSSGRANTFVGTYNYMSPERIIGGSYGITADIWSLGLVLLECATGKFPYSPPEQAEGWTNIFELMEEIVEQPPPCAPSDQFSPEFCSFISACLQKDPKERKSSHELLALPFLNMYDDMDVDLSSYFTYAGSPIAIDRTQNVIMLEKKSKKKRTDKTEQKRATID